MDVSYVLCVFLISMPSKKLHGVEDQHTQRHVHFLCYFIVMHHIFAGKDLLLHTYYYFSVKTFSIYSFVSHIHIYICML